ncbi:MAG: DUF4234 domain-containing protein [Thermoleophilia bacterium]|jgi:hypothetical protein|nr:DUF4234 domain-containing protein [Thermoleophilia bacterium]
MAEEIQFQGALVKRRNPWGVWLLSLITLGVYGVVFWYKINREMRDYSAAAGKPLDNDPVNAVLAVTLGALVIVPAVISWVHTARRARAVRQIITGDDTGGPSSGITVLLAFLGGFQTIYLQYGLNECWDRARRVAGGAAAPVTAPPPDPVG